MSLILSGTDGLSDIDGSAATPAIRGTDANTGIFFPAADTIAFSEGGVEAMRIDSSGNVGIGTASPQSTFQVGSVNAGTSESTNKGLVMLQSAPSSIDSAGGLEFKTSSSGSGYGWKIGGLNTTNDPFVIGNRSNSATFTERMRIDSSGRLIISYSAASSLSAVGCYNETTGAGANMVIVSNGYMIRSTSSLKYKKNVQDAPYGIADVMRLRPVTYESKNESEDGVVYGGLIAEEVHEQGLTQFVQYADDGTPDAISYGNMVSLAFKAIQEQQALITALTTRITALEAK